MSANGAFSNRFARKKQWKLDPGLCKAIEHFHEPDQSIVDIGAGVGKYVEWMRQDLGADVFGVDGIEGVEELSEGLVEHMDLTATIAFNPPYDSAICIEVAEHIHHRDIPTFLRNVNQLVNGRLLWSAAVVGQRGRAHVSCHMPEWWSARICDMTGWSLNEEQTLEVRNLAGKGWDRKLMVFER